MADSKISALPASTVPLAGTEILPIVQSSTTKQVSVANLTAGRAISATQLTLTAGNVIVANTYGIDFSATSGTGTSELLADYEEGTWTPVLQFDANTQSITVQQATYVKVGKAVSINMGILYGAKSGSGRVFITGLPFAKEAGGTTAVVAGCTGGTVTTTEALFYNIDAGGTTLNFAQQTGDISSGSLAGSGTLFCSGTYFA